MESIGDLPLASKTLQADKTLYKGRSPLEKSLFFIALINGVVRPILKEVQATFGMFCGPLENRPKDD